jgi:hypothetical protein
VGPAVDEHKAETDAKGLVAEIYQTIDRGKTDSLFSLLTDPVVVFGPRRTDAMQSRSDALVALGKVIDPKAPKPKNHVPLHSGGLAVVASDGGHSAWMFDVIRIDGQLLAATAVLSNTDDLWAVTAAALAETPTGKQIKAEAAKDAIVPPGATAAARIAPGAAPAVEKFKKGLVEQQAWGDDLVKENDAIVIGPTAGEVVRGRTAIKRQWKARMKSNLREAASGDIAAAMTTDGQLVWISVPITRVADGEEPMPLRIFAVYAKEGAGWRMTALHEALAFDEAGSGAAWKKIVPPAPAPPPEPAKVETTEAKADPATDKKPDDTAAAKKKTRTKKKPKKPAPPPPSDE